MNTPLMRGVGGSPGRPIAAAIGLALSVVAILGCGGASGSSTTQSTTVASKDVFQCLFLHGYKPVPDSTKFGGFNPSGGTAPGYMSGLAIKLNGVTKPVIVSFYSSNDDAAKAERLESSIVKGTQGGTDLNSNVVVFHGTPVPQGELTKIESCVR